MKFTDFKPEELIGKLVLVESNTASSISKIKSVTKASFKIDSDSDASFRLSDGGLKGITSSRLDFGRFCNCSLISEDEAKKLIEKWRKNKLTREMRKALIEKVPTLCFEELEKINAIINN